jgi:predicted Fe-S protein YdhL (DUF1289 family)
MRVQNVVSPCVSVCRLDPAQGLCTGCFRTMDEIAGWSEMTIGERARVLDAVAARRALPPGQHLAFDPAENG